MSKSRDLIYLNAYPNEDRIVSCGIEFKEFMTALENPLDNILVLAGYFDEGEFDYTTRCNFIREEIIPNIINTDVYKFGDFCWVDFTDIESLGTLEPREVAELLYLGHMMKPVASPFFDKLNNRFSYLAHDDGWFNTFYSRNLREFEHIIGKVIRLKVNRRKVVPEIPLEISNQLIEYAQDGLLLDFDHVIRGRSLEIPIFSIGKMLNMDDMYNNLQKHLQRAKFGACLVLKKSGWSIQPYYYR
ncbi:hypothetical protein [Desulfosporosinus hippei]|uniref:Uncharacterized protein n=1 Tax=Desulfosporosinus hippei DSM 8344 TaxID=1121419 RepID=A0A1G8C506_9FIRM|nr:hypothetical protein [Desulfosporosinus hippei]SDH40408.1 hypothetical protein SAMN05443529_1133 [Desulfosporosinus hippei DSM 8344]